MRAQGFEYTPVDPFARQQAVTGKARGNAQSDPNDRIRKALTGADRAAYDRALWGENPGVTFAEALDTGDFSELGGCTNSDQIDEDLLTRFRALVGAGVRPRATALPDPGTGRALLVRVPGAGG